MTHPFSYAGRRVVVTGGATGVGAALLDVLAEFEAAHVTVLDVKRPDGPHDAYVSIDLGDEQAVRGVVAQVDDPCTHCSTTRVSPTRNRRTPCSP
jgi:NAD(P)-dependent dehydrogenase (short-subunit alcohol dehydrogenase family)